MSPFEALQLTCLLTVSVLKSKRPSRENHGRNHGCYSPGLPPSGLGWVYAVSGRRADALKIAQALKDLSSRTYVDFYQVAEIYAGLGDKDEAFRLIEKGYAQHSATMPWLGIDFFWYEMRSDPRYADLLRRMGLPQPE
jgi:hypothetical protein